MTKKAKIRTKINPILGAAIEDAFDECKTPDELSEMESEFGEFRVYIVEVCRDCSWNHLSASFVLGDGIERKPPRRVRTLEDEDWVKG